jgi:hypothetical protein
MRILNSNTFETWLAAKALAKEESFKQLSRETQRLATKPLPMPLHKQSIDITRLPISSKISVEETVCKEMGERQLPKFYPIRRSSLNLEELA